jgi:integrase
MVNPCLRASGIQRNPESKRERYVDHDEYNEVWECAGRSVRLLMALTYRTLQRPESDLIRWDRREVVKARDGKRVLDFRQWKTGRQMVIAFTPELDSLIPVEVVVALRRGEPDPIIRRLDGKFYTYDGLSGMLKEAIAVANERRAARRKPLIPSFGFRDLKGKGATDMWRAGVPLEQIQALLGHANKTTTEIYVKQRWREAVEPNKVQVR